MKNVTHKTTNNKLKTHNFLEYNNPLFMHKTQSKNHKSKGNKEKSFK